MKKFFVLSFYFISIFAGKEPLQITCTCIKRNLGQLNSNQSIHILRIGTKKLKINSNPGNEIIQLKIICPFIECNVHKKENRPRNVWVTYLVLDATKGRIE